MSRETFLLKKSFFSIYSNAGQDFEDEIANEEQDKKEAAEKAAMKYYKIRSGDTLGGIARRWNDRDEHLPPERHQIDHRAAHRTLAAGAIGQLPMRNRRTFRKVRRFSFGRKRRRFVPQPKKTIPGPRRRTVPDARSCLSSP